MKIAYLHCFSGISGDMFLGALVDAGVDPKLLEKTVNALDIGARLEVSKVNRSGITATKVDVIVGGQKDVPQEAAADHHHEHSHDHEHEAEHSHEHNAHEAEHHEHSEVMHAEAPHEHEHEHEHAHGRSLKDIRHIIAHADISSTAKRRATAIFEALGRAEAKIHNKELESIHFHEVGSVDAIVDIVCAAVGSDALGVDRWICSPLNVGGGTVVCAHGTFPVPAPATLELLQSRKAPVFSSGVQKELVTPTGAAVATVLADDFGPMPGMTVHKVGYGAGYHDLPGQANVLQITFGEPVSSDIATKSEDSKSAEAVSVLETTIDDMTAEMFGHLMERVMAAGALDMFLIPAQMKKNRPGTLVTVLARTEDCDRIAQLMFAETTTIGIRVRNDNRYVLPRKQVEVETRWGMVRIKVAGVDGSGGNCAPEYEDCRRIANEKQVPLKNVMQEAVRVYLQSKANHHE